MSMPPRSRARRKAPEERAAEILAAAKSLALAEGIGAVTLRSVAQHAGVAPALVAHYVEGMDRLIADTFRTIVADERREVSALITTELNPVARMDALLATMIDGSRDDVTLIWVEAWAHGRRNDALADVVRSEMDGWQYLIRSVIDEGLEAGAFHTTDPAAAAWQILGMVDGLNAQSLVRWGDSVERGSMLRAAVAGVLGESAPIP